MYLGAPTSGNFDVMRIKLFDAAAWTREHPVSLANTSRALSCAAPGTCGIGTPINRDCNISAWSEWSPCTAKVLSLSRLSFVTVHSIILT